MKINRLGCTNVEVTDVAFGCANIGNLYREIPEEIAHETLQIAWDAGIRYFDTAPHYGRGLSELRVGSFLQRRTAFKVSTKVGRVLTPAKSPIAEADGFLNPAQNDVHYDYSGDGIEESFEQSLERLGLSYIDILYVHDLGSYTHGEGNIAHMADFLGSGYERLVRLKEARRIGAFGLGVNESQVCLDVMAHGPIDVILLAGRLTLLDRSAEKVLVPQCQKSNTSLVLGGIFNSGILATGPIEGATYDYGPAPKHVLEQVAKLQDQAQAQGLTLAEAALHFARLHPAASSILIGTANPISLRRNLAALAKTVSREIIASLV